MQITNRNSLVKTNLSNCNFLLRVSTWPAGSQSTLNMRTFSFSFTFSFADWGPHVWYGMTGLSVKRKKNVLSNKVFVSRLVVSIKNCFFPRMFWKGKYYSCHTFVFVLRKVNWTKSNKQLKSTFQSIKNQNESIKSIILLYYLS